MDKLRNKDFMGLKRIGFLAVFCVIALGVSPVNAQHIAGKRATPSVAENSNGGTSVSSVASSGDEFVIGDADVLQVSIWQEPQLSTTATVRPDGYISLPLINEVKVAGLTTTEAQRALEADYKKFLTEPRVSVTISEIRSRKVFITGEVSRPGSYPLLTPTSVLQLIAEAGGFTPFSKRNKIVILRPENGHQTRFRFVYSSVLKGDPDKQNISLKPNDTVVVP